MRSIVALAALLCAAPSSPEEVATGPGTPYFAGMPPVQYDGTGAAVVIFTNDVSQFCGTAPDGLVIVACVRRTATGTPFMFLPNPKPLADAGDPYARIIHHELAHVRGWGANHPEE